MIYLPLYNTYAYLCITYERTRFTCFVVVVVVVELELTAVWETPSIQQRKQNKHTVLYWKTQNAIIFCRRRTVKIIEAPNCAVYFRYHMNYIASYALYETPFCVHLLLSTYCNTIVSVVSSLSSSALLFSSLCSWVWNDHFHGTYVLYQRDKINVSQLTHFQHR